MANINTTHENDVIFNMDSLREFIKLIKKQGAENIDFYAVSELLQPPGENVTTIALTGSRDENLQPWIDLYNNTRRQEMEENNILQNFQQLNGNKYQRTESVRNSQVEVWQYLPEQQGMDTTVENGVITGTKIRVDQPAKFTQITNQDNIVTSLCIMDGYVYDFSIGGYVETQKYSEVDYTGQQIFDTQFNLALEFQKITKPKNTKENPMNYYSNLENLLSDLTTKPVINIDGKDLYLNRPVMPTGNEIKVFFVLNANEKAKLINALSAYLDYNKQINRLQDKKLVSQYERKKIQNDNNEPWWKFIYVKHNGASVYSIEGQEEPEPYREFNLKELQNNPGKIVVVRKIFPWQPVLNGEEETEKWKVNISTGRHLYLQAGSLLEFNPDDFTTEQDLIDDYLARTTPGTFSVNENNGQKVHVITVRGFDKNGDFNNKGFSIKGNPIGYIKEADIPRNSADKNGKYKIKDDNYNLTDTQKNNLLKPVIDQNNNIIGYSNSITPNANGICQVNTETTTLLPVQYNQEVIGYIKQENIPSTTNEDGDYEINGEKYDLESNVIIWITKDIVPVYEVANNNSITTNIINADEINLSGNGNSTGDKTKFLRNDSTWANQLYGPLTLGDKNIDNTNVRLGIWGTGDVDANGNDSAKVSIHTKGGIKADLNIWGNKVFKAVFNDYAEYRQTVDDLTPGHVVIDNDNGSLSCATQRLQPGAQVISDTFGDAMGWTEKCQTPIAVAGRVLVYTYQPRENYHAGMAVCSAPNGTIDIMTREEIKEYPDCIIGIVSEIPNYEKWGTDQVDVNGRIWIRVK